MPSTFAVPPQTERGFVWSSDPEPHAARRREMLQKYPQIKALYGPCTRTKYVCTLLVLVQLDLRLPAARRSLVAAGAVAYLFGGVINQALLLAIHELSHNLAFQKPWQNRLFALFVNLPVGVPVAETFRYYHLLHHVHQGRAGHRYGSADRARGTSLERSVAVPAQAAVGDGAGVCLRAYARCSCTPSGRLAQSSATSRCSSSFNALILHFWGGKALAYLPISSLIVMGLHPVAGHYISEHYVFREGQETYSYYGPLNRLTFNVGYHNEHHDFPYIAGSRLAELRALAPEYYDSLYSHSSWTKTLWLYISRPSLGGYSRVKRR